MRHQAELQAVAELKEEQQDDPPITVRGGEPDADEKRAALLERIKSREVAAVAREDEKFKGALNNRESAFAHWLWRLWEEAQWIQTVQEFPDGQPMRTQSRHRRDVWTIFISAMNRRMWGDSGSGSGNGSGDEQGDLDATN